MVGLSDILTRTGNMTVGMNLSHVYIITWKSEITDRLKTLIAHVFSLVYY